MSTRHEGLLEGRAFRLARCGYGGPSRYLSRFKLLAGFPILPEKGSGVFSNRSTKKDSRPFSIPLAPIEATCYSVNRPLNSFCLMLCGYHHGRSAAAALGPCRR